MEMPRLAQIYLLCVLLCLCSADRFVRSGREDEIGSHLSVECGVDSMIARLEYDLVKHRSSMTSSVSAMLSNSIVFIQNIEKCVSVRNTSKKEHVLEMKYEDCGIVKTTMSYGEEYTVNAAVISAPKQNRTSKNTFLFPLSCTVLTESLSETRFDLKQDGETLVTSGEFLATSLNSQLEIEIQPLFAAYTGKTGIYTSPSKCWVSSVAHPSDRVVLIDKGCPQRRGHVLASLYQGESKPQSSGSTTIYVNFIREVLPLKHQNMSSSIVTLNLQCEVFFCSSDSANRIYGVPMCLSAAPCEQRGGGSQPLLGSSGGPATVLARLPLPIRVDMQRDGGHSPLTSPIQQPIPPTLKSEEDGHQTTAGLFSLPALIGSAAAAFVMGCLVVGGIWLCCRIRSFPPKMCHPCVTASSVSQSEPQRVLSVPYSSLESKPLVSGLLSIS